MPSEILEQKPEPNPEPSSELNSELSSEPSSELSLEPSSEPSLEPISAQRPEPSPEQRLHPLSIGFAFLSSLRGWVLPLGVALVSANAAGLAWQAWTLPFLIPQALAAIARYLTFRYRFDPSELVIRSGVLARKVRHIPYSRIQSLDAVRNPLHRLGGVVEARVQTGSGDAEPEAALSVLSLAAYEEMRRRLDEARRPPVGAPATAGALAAAAALPPDEAEARDGALPAPSPPVRTLLALPPREILLSGLLEGRGSVIVALLFGLYWESKWVGGGAPFAGSKGPWEKESARQAIRDLVPSWEGIGEWAGHRVGLALLAVAAFLLLLRLVSAAWALVRLHGFRLTREGETLRSEHGLWTRVLASLPLHRIQALTISSGVLQRLAGRVSVRVEAAGLHPKERGGGEGGEEGGRSRREKLAPILRREALPALLRELLPGVEAADFAWRPPAPRAFRRELKGSLIVLLPLAVPAFIFLRFWGFAVLALLIAGSAIGAHFTVRHLGWAVVGEGIAFRSGWLRRRVTIAPFAKVQAVDLHDSPFDRRAGMARIRVDTAGAGADSHRVEIPYLTRGDAEGLYRLLTRQAARSAFRW